MSRSSKKRRSRRQHKAATNKAELINRTAGTLASTFIDEECHHDESTVVRANHVSGLSHSAAWRGVNFITDMVMKVPCHVMKSTDNDGHEKDRSHFAYRALRREANPFMSAGSWRQLAVFQAVWWGEHVSYIERDEDGNAKYYWPLKPRSYAKEITADGRLLYHTHIGGSRFTFEDSDAFVLFGLSQDGISGVDFISYARNTLGHGITLRTFSTKFFTSGAKSSGTLYLPPGMKKDEVKRWITQMREQSEGLRGAHTTMVLFDGMKYEPRTIPPEAAQFLETYALNDKHVANFLKLPGFVVGVEKSVSYNSLEQARQEVLDSGIDPWLCKIEDEHWRKTLSERQKDEGTHSIHFERKALMRVSFADKIEGMKTQVQTGILTPNAALKANDQPGMGPVGDKHMMPMNHTFIEDFEPPDPDSGTRVPDPTPAENRQRAAAEYVIRNDLGRSRRLFSSAVNKLTKSPQKLQGWAEGEITVEFDPAKQALGAAQVLAQSHGVAMSPAEIVDGWSAEMASWVADRLDLPLGTTPERYRKPTCKRLRLSRARDKTDGAD